MSPIVVYSQSYVSPPPGAAVAPSTGLLTSNDFTYLGRVGVPITGDWSFSRAALAGRMVGGVQHLFIAGAESNVERLFEVTIPTPYLGVGQIPVANRVTVVTAWGDVSGGNLLTEDPTHAKQYIRGLKWREDLQRLVWNYTIYYGTETSPPGNPVVGLSRLNADGTVTPHGPWRGSLAFNRCCGSIVDVPAWFQAAHNVGPMACSAAQFSQVAFLGANMQAFEVPVETTPRDTPVDWVPAEQNTHVTIPFKTLIYHDLDHAQAKILDPDWFSCSGGSTITPDVAVPLPAIMGGGRAQSSACIDWWDTAVWIETPTKRGILYLGEQMHHGHNWYGNYARTDPGQPPTGTCWHGLTAGPVGGGIGPGGTSCYVVGAFYDPLDFGKVADGLVPEFSLTPYQEFTADQFANNSNFPKNGKDGTVTFQFGGCHYEPSTGLLYVTEQQVEYLDFNFLPVVHIFRIN